MIDKHRNLGLAICCLLNFVLEYLKNVIDMNVDIYRLLIFRYIFVISFGVYLYYEKGKKITWFSFLCSGVGLVYIITFCYCGMTPIVTNMWVGTSMFASMFIFVIMKWLISLEHIRQLYLELLGKASFNIFLVQMFYYWPVDNVVNGVINNKLLQLLAGFVFSIGAGVIFYKIESPITTRIIKRIRN